MRKNKVILGEVILLGESLQIVENRDVILLVSEVSLEPILQIRLFLANEFFQMLFVVDLVLAIEHLQNIVIPLPSFVKSTILDFVFAAPIFEITYGIHDFFEQRHVHLK